MTGRLRHALAAGLRAALLATFANAAIVVVFAAALHDVNHVHEEGAPEHVHALGEVFGPASASVPPVAVLAAESSLPTTGMTEVDAPTPCGAWSDCGVRDPPTEPAV
jgi:Mn2+/Fe2+ NRAMP family transporter